MREKSVARDGGEKSAENGSAGIAREDIGTYTRKEDYREGISRNASDPMKRRRQRRCRGEMEGRGTASFCSICSKAGKIATYGGNDVSGREPSG